MQGGIIMKRCCKKMLNGDLRNLPMGNKGVYCYMGDYKCMSYYCDQCGSQWYHARHYSNKNWSGWSRYPYKPCRTTLSWFKDVFNAIKEVL